MLSIFSSVEETGQYSVAFRFASLVFFVSTAFGQAWSPYAIKIKTDNPDSYRGTYADIFLGLIFFMLVVGGGLALFSGELIGLVMPVEYGESALPLAILCFAIVLQSTQQITATGISLEKKTMLLAKISWGAAVVNFVGNYFLIPYLGAVGASIATFVSYLFITTCYLFFTQRLHPLPIKWIKLVVFISLGSCVLLASIIFNSLELNLVLIMFKLLLCAVCLTIGCMIFPIKDFVYGAK